MLLLTRLPLPDGGAAAPVGTITRPCSQPGERHCVLPRPCIRATTAGPAATRACPIIELDELRLGSAVLATGHTVPHPSRTHPMDNPYRSCELSRNGLRSHTVPYSCDPY